MPQRSGRWSREVDPRPAAHPAPAACRGVLAVPVGELGAARGASAPVDPARRASRPAPAEAGDHQAAEVLARGRRRAAKTAGHRRGDTSQPVRPASVPVAAAPTGVARPRRTSTRLGEAHRQVVCGCAPRTDASGTASASAPVAAPAGIRPGSAGRCAAAAGGASRGRQVGRVVGQRHRRAVR